MPAWAWILFGLTALGLLLRLLDDRLGSETTERLGAPLTILFILAVLGAIVLGLMNADWR